MKYIKNWIFQDISFFGYERKRFEFFINGIVFLIFKSTYDCLSIIKKLPENWSIENFSDYNIEKYNFVSYLLFFISYLIINHAFFYDKEKNRVKNAFDSLRIFCQKIILMTLLIAISAIISFSLLMIFL